MNVYVVGGGAVLILLGVGAFAGLPLFSVVASSVSVDCANWPTSCAVSAPVTNSGITGFTAPFTAYFVYKDNTGTTDLIDQVVWSVGQTTVIDTGFSQAKVPGAGGNFLGFTVNVFFWDANGYPMGSATSQTFSIPTQFTIFYSGVGTVTVTPPGELPTSCASVSCSSSGLAYYKASWSVGTSLNVTTSSGVSPVTWTYGGTSATACSAKGSGFTCTILSQGSGTAINAAFISGGSSVSQNLIIVNSGGGSAATISPQSVCLSATAYQTSTYGNCGPTASFTLTPASGLTWSGSLWSITTLSNAQLSPPVKGNSTTVSLSYSQLSPSVTFSSGIANLQLSIAQAVSPVTFSMLQEPLGNGGFASTTPAAGVYTCSSTSSVCKPGGTVSVSVTVPRGYQFQGWIVNGQNVGTANPYTVSIPTTGAVAVAPVLISCPTGTNCPMGGGGGNGFGGGSQVIGVVMVIGGAVTIAIGSRMKGKDGEA